MVDEIEIIVRLPHKPFWKRFYQGTLKKHQDYLELNYHNDSLKDHNMVFPIKKISKLRFFREGLFDDGIEISYQGETYQIIPEFSQKFSCFIFIEQFPELSRLIENRESAWKHRNELLAWLKDIAKPKGYRLAMIGVMLMVPMLIYLSVYFSRIEGIHYFIGALEISFLLCWIYWSLFLSIKLLRGPFSLKLKFVGPFFIIPLGFIIIFTLGFGAWSIYNKMLRQNKLLKQSLTQDVEANESV